MLEASNCPLCGSADDSPLLAARDPLHRAPGTFRVVQCRRCGFTYLNPALPQRELRQKARHGYGPSLTRPPHRSAFHGGRLLRSATRWALAHYLGYHHLDERPPDPLTRLVAWFRSRRLALKFPPFVGQGRLLDIGCWTGTFLERMREVGWTVAGIELLPDAAILAREVTENIFIGDLLDAPFPDQSFDMVTAFHTVEHLPDPLAALRRIVRWLAPNGLGLVEVPNFAGMGRRLFGPAWHGLNLPFHLSHFTPDTLTRAVERAGGQVVHLWHVSDRQYVTKSLEITGANFFRALLRLPPARRVSSLILWLACQLGFGEAIRVMIRAGES